VEQASSLWTGRMPIPRFIFNCNQLLSSYPRSPGRLFRSRKSSPYIVWDNFFDVKNHLAQY